MLQSGLESQKFVSTPFSRLVSRLRECKYLLGESKTQPQSFLHNLKLKLRESTDELSFDRNIDYSWLEDLLRAGMWRTADWETLRVMVIAIGQASGLNDDNIKNFSCTDLCTIDRLWVKYSNGRFGFSVQKRIWQDTQVNENWDKFKIQVGWRDALGTNPLNPNYSLQAPQGHLPRLFIYPKIPRQVGYNSYDEYGISCWVLGSTTIFSNDCQHKFNPSTFFSRIKECNL